MAGVRRITLVDASGTHELFRGPKNRVPRWARPAERRVRRVRAARIVRLTTLEGLHDRSNARRRNGWLRDLARNHAKAHRKAIKALRKSR